MGAAELSRQLREWKSLHEPLFAISYSPIPEPHTDTIRRDRSCQSASSHHPFPRVSDLYAHSFQRGLGAALFDTHILVRMRRLTYYGRVGNIWSDRNFTLVQGRTYHDSRICHGALWRMGYERVENATRIFRDLT